MIPPIIIWVADMSAKMTNLRFEDKERHTRKGEPVNLSSNNLGKYHKLVFMVSHTFLAEIVTLGFAGCPPYP